MKKLIIILLLLFPIGLKAQWYQSYGVTNINELSKDQLNMALLKANNTINAGKILTIGGLIGFVGGYIIYTTSLNNIANGNTLNPGGAEGGALIMWTGAMAAGIGIPLLISGGNRKSDIQIALKKYENVGMIGLKINF